MSKIAKISQGSLNLIVTNDSVLIDIYDGSNQLSINKLGLIKQLLDKYIEQILGELLLKIENEGDCKNQILNLIDKQRESDRIFLQTVTGLQGDELEKLCRLYKESKLTVKEFIKQYSNEQNGHIYDLETYEYRSYRNG